MKDQFEDEAEKMAKNFVDTVHKEHEATGGFDTQDQVETILLSTIPLAELLRDKARLDWLEARGHHPEFLMNLSQDARNVIDAAIKEETK